MGCACCALQSSFSCVVRPSVVLLTVHPQIDPKMCVASHSVAVTYVMFCLTGERTSYNVFRTNTDVLRSSVVLQPLVR